MNGDIMRRPLELPIEQKYGWIRGKALVRDGYVVLSKNERRFYSPNSEEFIGEREFVALFDFLHLDINNAVQVETFVKRYGLLTETGLKEGQEPLLDWTENQKDMNAILRLHYAMEEVIKGSKGDPNGLEILLKIMSAKLRWAHNNRGQKIVHGIDLADVYINATQEGILGYRNFSRPTDAQLQQLLRLGGHAISAELSYFMELVTSGVSYEPVPKETYRNTARVNAPGYYALTPLASDLQGFLYLQIVFFIMDLRELKICPCGIPFPPDRADQIYHSKTCSGRARQERYEARK